MRTIAHALIAAVFAIPLAAVALTTLAENESDLVKTGQEPYKPGRQADGDDAVKTSKEPYKPGREADEGGKAVGSARAPYKPGREAEEGSGSKK